MEPTIETLARLVAWPTVSDRSLSEMAAWLAERAESAGFRVERLSGGPGKCNVVASAGPEGVDGLVLSGHMDVVPVEGQPWTSDPFKLTERDGRLHARGACDMKGFIAAAVEAVAGLDPRKLERELVLVWTYDEEVGCKGSAALAEQLAHRAAPLPSLALIGEPTDFRLCRMHPGHLSLEVSCGGRAAHSSRPELGANAISVARRVLGALEGMAEQLRQERAFEQDLDRPYAIVNVGMIEGGTAINIVPDRCTIRLGVRPLPGQPVDALIQRFQDAVAEVHAEVSAWGGSAALRPLHLAPALLTPPDTDLERLLRPHAACDPGCAVPFATDGGNLEKMGVRSIIFGPGSIEMAHRADEYVEAADLLRAKDIIADLVRGRCWTPPAEAPNSGRL